MIVTADTNLFVYAVDEREPDKKAVAIEIVGRLQEQGAPIGLQVCGEFFRAATRRLKRTPWEAAQGARNLLTSFPVFTATSRSVTAALAAAAAGQFSFWDANLLAAADEAGCDVLLSEDFRDGTRLGRVVVVQPFAAGGISIGAKRALAGEGTS